MATAAVLPRLSFTLPRLNFTHPVLQVLKGHPPTVCQIQPTASAFRAAVHMMQRPANASLIVTSVAGGKMTGIVTERDFFKLQLTAGSARSTPISSIMTPAAAITSASCRFTVEKCVRLMRGAGVRHLPIVQKDGTVSAVFAMHDITRQVADAFKNDPIEKGFTVGDVLESNAERGDEVTRALRVDASVAEAITTMKETKKGALLVSDPSDKAFGLFTERDFLSRVVPFDEQDPACVRLGAVSTFTSGHSKQTLDSYQGGGVFGGVPRTITCVERSTPVEVCLSLMLAQGSLYVPVSVDKKPIDVVSMRDINKFLAPLD